MKLKIKAHPKNNFPLRGILIKNASVEYWIQEIQVLNFSMNEVEIYPIPGTVANTIWGCLVVFEHPVDAKKAGKNEMCQMVAANLFVPEKSILIPALTITETEKLFSAAKHILHPEFGLVELTEPLPLEQLINKPIIRSIYITKPEPPVFIPKQIKSFQIKPVSPEAILNNLDQNIFPKKKRMEDVPLNIFEKGKLAFYKLLFTKTKDKKIATTERTGILAKLAALVDTLTGKGNKFADKLQEDFENLEERNRKQIDKLMDLFKTDPGEALKYAIPLDEKGSTRGGTNLTVDLSKRWFDLSLFGSTSGSASGSVNIGDHFNELRTQYNATAEEFIRQKDYHKAAFIYMKLLQNHHLAAQTLENGGHYQEAATIYLKHTNNKKKAAECYEKGNMTNEAIDLYKELKENEKVGDLYLALKKRKEANNYFTKVVDEYKSKNQFIKAALVCKNKMDDTQTGQHLLIEGWRTKQDQINCLNNYFSNITDIKILKTEIDHIYTHEVNPVNVESFLQVIRHEFNKKNALSEPIRDMAYEIIAGRISENPSIASEINGFNKNDKELMKDTLRFKVGRNK